MLLSDAMPKRNIAPKWILVWIGALMLAVAVGCASDTSGTTSNSSGSSSESSSGSQSEMSTKQQPELTAEQQNALDAAEAYLDMSAFSKQGLIEQLSSSAGDGYPKKAAKFAANHVDVDWNAQAVKAARDYLDMTSFSKQGLIEQLSSSAGDGYTLSQATYAVDKVYR